MSASLVGSEMCIRDRVKFRSAREVRSRARLISFLRAALRAFLEKGYNMECSGVRVGGLGA
eukprot:10284834-Alexandrium_andersonii.AAC.1